MDQFLPFTALVNPWKFENTGFGLSLLHKSKRLHSPSDNERNNLFGMLEGCEESF